MTKVVIVPKPLAAVSFDGGNEAEIVSFLEDDLGLTVSSHSVSGTTLELVVDGNGYSVDEDSYVVSPTVGGGAFGIYTPTLMQHYVQVYP
jgi:hypothetical protein